MAASGMSLAERLEAALATVAQLEEALVTNRVIGIAVGIVMCRNRLPRESAFALLVEHSQVTNRPVLALAEHVVDHGELPTTSTGRRPASEGRATPAGSARPTHPSPRRAEASSTATPTRARPDALTVLPTAGSTPSARAS